MPAATGNSHNQSGDQRKGLSGHLHHQILELPDHLGRGAADGALDEVREIEHVLHGVVSVL